VVLRNVLTLDRLVVCDCASQTTYVVTAAKLTPIATHEGGHTVYHRSIRCTEEQMKIATARQRPLEPYLTGCTAQSVAARQLARQFQVDVRTVRRWVARFERWATSLLSLTCREAVGLAKRLSTKSSRPSSIPLYAHSSTRVAIARCARCTSASRAIAR